MSNEAVSHQQKNQEQDEQSPELKEAIAKIKTPSPLYETVDESSPEEALSNPAVAPQMSSDIREIREDLKRD